MLVKVKKVNGNLYQAPWKSRAFLRGYQIMDMMIVFMSLWKVTGVNRVNFFLMSGNTIKCQWRGEKNRLP